MNIQVHPISSIVASTSSCLLQAKPKKSTKTYYGAHYVNLKYDLGAKTSDGWFSFEDVVLTKTSFPAVFKHERNNAESTQVQLHTTVSNSGALGAALMKLQPAWISFAKSLAGGRTVKDLLQMNTSVALHGELSEAIADPLIRLEISFRRYPKDYFVSFLAGTQETQILDYSKPYTHKGKIQYRPATVYNVLTDTEELINEDNVHLFLAKGVTIRRGRVDMSSARVSEDKITLRMRAVTLIVEAPPCIGFDDDEDADETIMSALNIAEMPKVGLAPLDYPKTVELINVTPAPAIERKPSDHPEFIPSNMDPAEIDIMDVLNEITSNLDGK